jgi:hypothetical protein
VRADRLDAVVWQALSYLLQTPTVIPRLHQTWAQAEPQHGSALAAQQTQLLQRRQRLERQSQRLLDAYQAEIISLSELQNRRLKLTAELQQIAQAREQLARTQQQTRHWQQVIDHAETFRRLLGTNLDRLSCEERQAVAHCLISKVVVTAEQVDISYVLPFEGAPQVADHPGSTPEGTPGHCYRLRLAHLHLPAPAVQRSEVGHTVDRRIEQHSDQGDLAGPEARRADAIPHLSEDQGRWQGRQGLPGEPRGTGLRFQPGHEWVVDA